MFAAVLDTCVLWPSLQRDYLLSVAAFGAYRPLWSEAILAELDRTETQKHVDHGLSLTEASTRSRHLLNQMRASFPLLGFPRRSECYGPTSSPHRSRVKRRMPLRERCK